jgi:serine/threonine protein kinase
MPDQFSNRIEHLFSEALRKPANRRRSEFLAESCAGDAAVRSRLEALLTAHERAGSFLETPITESDDWGFALQEEFSREGEPGGVSPRSTPVAYAPGSPSQADLLAFLDEPEQPDELGSFHGYGVTELLGRGGAGIVLKARDRRLNRNVALKVLAPQWAAQPHARKRFLREARAAAAVRHEHVVSIHAVDETAALPFLVMEYIPGESLQERIRRDGPLEIGEVLWIGRQAASGLAAAHAQRLVHRDVKPANILLERETGHARITDFGLARTVDDVGITQEGIIAGTPQYMSPEQAKGNPVDFRSDLFSLGSVLYAMCAGVPPFQAETTMAVMRKICEASPRLISELRPETPPELARLIGELLEKGAAKRPQTADDVARRLDDMRSDPDASSVRDAGLAVTVADAASVRTEAGSFGHVNSWRRRIVWGCAGATAVVVVAIVAFGPWGSKEGDNSAFPGKSNGVARDEQRATDLFPSSPSAKKPTVRKESKPSLNAMLFGPDVKPLSEIRRMAVPGQRIDSLAVSPDGTRVYAGCSNGLIYVWDTRTGKEIRKFPGHRPVTNLILLSSDGTRMVTFGADRHMRVWNTKTGITTLHARLWIPVRSAALSPDGTEAAVSFFGGKAGARLAKMSRQAPGGGKAVPAPVHDKVSIFSTVTGRRLRFLADPRTDSFHNVDWSPDGRFVAAGIEAGRVLLFDAKSGAIEKELQASGVPGPAYDVHFSRDGKRLFAAGSGNLIWGWELPGDKVVLRRRFMHGVVRFAVSSDGRWLAFGGRPEIRLLPIDESAGSAALLNVEGHTSAILSVAFIPNADVLVSCGRDGTVRLWRMPDVAAPADASVKPVVKRLSGSDGYAVDTNLDGVFDTVETTSTDLRVTRPTGTGTFPREVALLEFDTRPYRGEKLVKAVLEVRVTLAQSSNRDPAFDLDVHAYPADGKVTREDGSAAGVLAGQLKSHDHKTVGTIRIPLDTAVIRRLISQGGHVGLRISNTRGNRLIFASRRTYFKDSAPVLEIHLRPRR